MSEKGEREKERKEKSRSGGSGGEGGDECWVVVKTNRQKSQKNTKTNEKIQAQTASP